MAFTISSYACSVTDVSLVNTELDDCVESSKTGIWKKTTTRVTFSDGDFDNLEAIGIGTCGSPSVSGSWTKCYPTFNAPHEIACSSPKCNCTRETQTIVYKGANCGLFSCSCISTAMGSYDLEEECFNETCPTCENPPSCDTGQSVNLQSCCCAAYPGGPCLESPILVDVSGDGFRLTDTAGGVHFDLNLSGIKQHVAWTQAGTDDALLVLDRDGNGTIDSGAELFGNHTEQIGTAGIRNGFLALAEFDKMSNGGNEDNGISNSDAVFSLLRLWQDVNHNGVSERGELKTLTELGIAHIDLEYKKSSKVDQYGNAFRYRSKVKDVRGAQVGRWAWDVFLVTEP